MSEHKKRTKDSNTWWKIQVSNKGSSFKMTVSSAKGWYRDPLSINFVRKVCCSFCVAANLWPKYCRYQMVFLFVSTGRGQMHEQIESWLLLWWAIGDFSMPTHPPIVICRTAIPLWLFAFRRSAENWQVCSKRRAFNLNFWERMGNLIKRGCPVWHKRKKRPGCLPRPLNLDLLKILL